MNDRAEDEEGFRHAIMVKATPVASAAALAHVLAQACKLYTEFGNPPPPAPSNLALFVPCSVLVHERHNVGTGERIGVIQLFRPNGAVSFEKEWRITDAR